MVLQRAPRAHPRRAHPLHRRRRKAEIYALMAEWAAQGKAILLISSERPNCSVRLTASSSWTTANRRRIPGRRGHPRTHPVRHPQALRRRRRERHHHPPPPGPPVQPAAPVRHADVAAGHHGPVPAPDRRHAVAARQPDQPDPGAEQLPSSSWRWGMLLVIVVGHIDLSVGSVAGFCRRARCRADGRARMGLSGQCRLPRGRRIDCAMQVLRRLAAHPPSSSRWPACWSFKAWRCGCCPAVARPLPGGLPAMASGFYPGPDSEANRARSSMLIAGRGGAARGGPGLA